MSGVTSTARGRTRPAAVAGMFYPDEPGALRHSIGHYLHEVDPRLGHEADRFGRPPKAIIAPHAGYPYSGPVAASAYACLTPHRGTIKRIVIMSPAHRVEVTGLAHPTVDTFDTPLGPVPVDRDALAQLDDVPGVDPNDRAHEPEHGIEVHLPFIIETLGAVAIVPLLFGETSHRLAAAAFERLWDGSETLLLVSSDLSHFLDHVSAQRRDRRTADAILARQIEAIGPYDACGHVAIQGLLAASSDDGPHPLHPTLLDLRNSGDTAGSPDRTVGYGAFRFD